MIHICMMRTFRYRMHPNAAQAQVLSNWIGQCCSLYNAALEQRITWWKQQQRSATRFQQHHDLTALRDGDEWWSSVPVIVQRSALDNVDRAYQAFFRRCNKGETPGFPRFRSRRRYDSFAVGRVKVRKDRVHIPKLGHVKMNLYRPIDGEIRNATLRRDASGKWWIGIQCRLPTVPRIPLTNILPARVVGIDLGLNTLAMLSTGVPIDNPRPGRRAQGRLARRQRRLARGELRSKNRERMRMLVAKAHANIANQRVDHARKEAKRLFERYDVICHEKLNIKGLACGMLAKSIHDASWGTFLRCLASKAEEAGKHMVPVDARKTSQLCSACGRSVEKTLSERVHRCVCGLTIDRDINAALNVLARGQRALELAKSNVEGTAS